MRGRIADDGDHDWTYLRHHVASKEIASTARAETPAVNICVHPDEAKNVNNHFNRGQGLGTQNRMGRTLWVRPQKVAHGALVRHLLLSVDCSNLACGEEMKSEPTTKSQTRAKLTWPKVETDGGEVRHLVERCDGGGKAAVDVEDPAVDHGRQGNVVEEFCTIPPHVDGPILAQALVVKTIHLGDLSALVVAADERNPIRVSNLA